MQRTLMQMGVGQLEDLFAKSKADHKVLKRLEHELQYRQVPRAVALLAEVQDAMYGKTAEAAAVESLPVSPPSPPMLQPGLWDIPPRQAPAPSPGVPASPLTAMRAPAMPSAAAHRQMPDARATVPVLSSMPVEDAYKLLKAVPGSTWESIEQTRRSLVLHAHPERLKGMALDKRANAAAEAKRVNEAYETLSRARCGTR